ncbi:autotransporter outer membrane beta-barrel domain-containing protein [Budvicia diplopodorum]|uniref:autotransporter outer membrane beta-barrel domain-containing protein n=1 Tax=Budvicia diplopodorum TaxID=1119056 RepID=UPI00135A0A82|nr:autotransporter outer membrane beta-barrel domain-containing protein [Budvicia diplopodorum]
MSRTYRITNSNPVRRASQHCSSHNSARTSDSLAGIRAKNIFRHSCLFAAISGLLLNATYAFADMIIDGGQIVTVPVSQSSPWNMADNLVVGDTTSGSLVIQNGGIVSNETGYVGAQAGSIGAVEVLGIGSQWNNNDYYLYVGYQGNGTLTINDSGVVTSLNSSTGVEAGSTGIASVSGMGSQWNNGGDFNIGLNGNGSLTISDGGTVDNGMGYIGYGGDSWGQAEVSGPGSYWNNSYNLFVGYEGHGTLTISDGGVVSNTMSSVGNLAGSTGIVSVSGIGSQWNVDGILFVGYEGYGTLTISDGGVVSAIEGDIGSGIAGSTGIVSVSGVRSQWNIDNALLVGGFAVPGNGTLTINDGGAVTSDSGYIAHSLGSTGVVEVSGVGSRWNNDNDLHVGFGGNGKLTISDGGVVRNNIGFIGFVDYSAGASIDAMGHVEVSGVGSQWYNGSELHVGFGNNGTLTIRDSGVVSSTGGYIGNYTDSTGVVNISGTGSRWDNNGQLFVGLYGNGQLTISDGGVVNNDDGNVGYSLGATGHVEVSGTGSQWNNSGELIVGYRDSGALTIADRAAVSASSMIIASESTSTGTLNIGNGNLSGALNMASITGGAGAATVNFNHTDDIAFSPQMSGTLSVNQMNQGTTTLTSANDYAGTTTVMNGTLQAGAVWAFSTSSDFTVGTAGQLNLAGYDQTVASLNNAGTVSFNGAPGTVLTVSGDYTGNNGLLNFNTVLNDDSSATDKLVVAGNTAGTTRVSVTNAGGSGAATLNGIELVQVNGTSDGEFVQQGRIVAGAYDYAVVRGVGANASNWYLTSLLTPVTPVTPATPVVPVTPNPDPAQNVLPMIERPEAGSYTSNLAAANSLFVTRLHDRLGETQYIDVLTGERKVTSMWLRNEGGHTKSRDANGQLDTQANRYVMQLGGDIAQWSSNDQNRLHLGVMAGYANSKNHTDSRWSGYSSRGTVDGYSTGLYATWYANEADKSGLYVDSWALYNWFNNRVDGQSLDSEEYKSNGVTASVESGYTFKLGENSAKNVSYFIQPKAQVIWMGVKADDHTEANGTKVSGEGDGNIQTRLGVRVFMNGYSEQDKGKDRVFQPFVEANWIHNTKDFGTTMDGATMKQDGAANIGELKVGVEGQINKRLNLWGNVGQQLGNNSYSDTAVMFGVKYSF